MFQQNVIHIMKTELSTIIMKKNIFPFFTKIVVIAVLLLFANFSLKGQSNDCSTATLLTVNATCTYTSGTTTGATQTIAGCTGTADDDVWYRFVATNSYQVITVHPLDAGMDPVVQLFSGICSSLISIDCMDLGFDGDDETINATGLTPGATYYIRVYHYYAGSGTGNFQICVEGSAITAPSNDEPCDAIPLPLVTSACNFQTFTTVGATATATAPTPSSCTGGSAPMQGGWNASSKDIWFTVVVPSSGSLVLSAKPSGVGITDGVMALYSGTCGSLTQIECYDDYDYAYPTVTSNQPMIIRTGLTPGQTLYIRYWGFGSSSGTFGICASTPINDDCSDALYICDLNGYSGTTSGAYYPDYPDNMDGTWVGTWWQGSTSYTSAGLGPFGWGHSSPDVQINNNSWVRFTAAAPTATLDVTVTDCWKTTPLGIQMQIFSANNCTTFDTVSNFSQSTSTLTITARNLTIGEDYYLMVDGFAGDICNYTIKASGGIAFSDITASSDTICIGSSVTLTGPALASSYEWVYNGSTSQSVIVTPSSTGSTTYTLYAYGACGAKQTLNATIYVNPLPVAEAGANATICNGASTSLSASGGTGYAWSPSSGLSATNISNPSANPSSTTVYTVTVTSNGCTASDNVTVTVNPLPTVNAGSDASIPNGTSTSLSGTASGGSGSYTYSWSPAASLVNPNDQNPTTTNLTTTTLFTLTVTDNTTGCSNTDQILITVTGSALSANSSATPNSICLNQSTQLNALGSGGSGSYTYSWSSNPAGFTSTSQNPTVSPITTTTYTVTINDGFNTSTSSVLVTVNVLPSANAGSDVSICSGNNTNLNATGGTTYAWSPSSGLSASNISNPVASPSLTTTYIVTVTNAAGCTSTDNITITVDALPTANAGADAEICSGSSTNLSASGGTTYSWSPSTGLSSTVISNPTATPSSSTTYSVIVTNSAGCSASDNVTITVNSLPTVNAGSDISIPNGTSTTLNGNVSGGSGSYSYSWTPASYLDFPTSLNPTTDNLSNTTVFILSVVDNVTGCQQSDMIVVTITGGALNVNTTASPSTICSGASVQLSALASGGSGVYTYTWDSNPPGFTSNAPTPIVSPVSTTSYMVTVDDGFNSVSGSALVIVNSTPVANAGSDINICSGTSTSLNASGGSTYSWSPSSGLSATNVASPNASPTSTTLYTVTVTSAEGCSSTDDILVTVNSVPTASAGADFSMCLGQSANLNASGGSTYLWSPSAGLSDSNISGPVATPSSTTNYVVTVWNSQGCSDSDDIIITVNMLPSANAGNDEIICLGDAALLNASGGSSYEWSPSSGLNNTSISDPSAAPYSTTNYIVTVTNSNGCTATDDVLVTVNQLPDASAGTDTSICNGETISLNASGGNAYAWSPSAGLSDSYSANPDASPSASTTYVVTVTDSNNCSSTDDISITVYPLPVAYAGTDSTICNGNSIQLSASGGSAYLWNTGDSTQNLTITPDNTTTYIVTVYDNNGCSSTDDVLIGVNATPEIYLTSDPADNTIYTGQLFTVTAEPTSYSNYSFYIDSVLVQNGEDFAYSTTSLQNGQIIFVTADESGCISLIDSVIVDVKPIPNAFTPINSDGVNDIFLKGLDVVVFNRWGQKIYSGTNGWDGKFNGSFVSKGTYYFTIKMKDSNNNIIEIEGSVTVVN